MTYIALLRAINLGPHNKIAMADLRDLFASLGFANVRTLILSGNVVFESKAQPTAAIEKKLEAATARELGVTTDYFVRTAKEWQAAIAANPFAVEASRNPKHLQMMCFKDAPAPAAVARFREVIRGREEVAAKGRQGYFVYADGIGTSKLTTASIEKHLGTRGTSRNWNTVLKLDALAGGSGS